MTVTVTLTLTLTLTGGGRAHQVIVNGDFVIVTEFADLADLERQGRQLPRESHLKEQFALQMLFQMALALEYLHSNLIVHRDIKPANIVLTSKGIFKVGATHHRRGERICSLPSFDWPLTWEYTRSPPSIGP